MADHRDFLHGLARQQAARYVAHTGPEAILLTGSAATGAWDGYADLDLICFYPTNPPEAAFLAARAAWVDATDRRADRWNTSGIGEVAVVHGVEVQVGHFPLATAERDIAAATKDFATDAVLHKKLLGIIEGQPLHGGATIAGWQARLAAYPDGLARAPVEQHLKAIFPLWFYRDHLARRDAAIWQRQALAEASLHLLGVLAGLNRRHFSATQLKRTRALVATLLVAPPDLAARLERLLAADVPTAIGLLEGLTGEVLALVARELPGVDIGVMARPPGAREQPWNPPG